MTFSRDPQQTYIYQANGVNEKINVILRSTLQVLTSFGDGGRPPGQFFGCHNVATDSKGNLYVAETYTGARIQRFLYKGIGTVERDQGVPWPKDKTENHGKLPAETKSEFFISPHQLISKVGVNLTGVAHYVGKNLNCERKKGGSVEIFLLHPRSSLQSIAGVVARLSEARV